jgi:hypothetical protein
MATDVKKGTGCAIFPVDFPALSTPDVYYQDRYRNNVESWALAPPSTVCFAQGSRYDAVVRRRSVGGR